MPRKSKKRVTFLEKSAVSGKGRSYMRHPRLPPLLPTLALPLHLTPLPARTLKQTAHSTLTPFNLPLQPPLLSSRPPAPPLGHRQVSGQDQPRRGTSPCSTGATLKRPGKKAEEMYRRVLYLTGQYEDRVRDMEELLEAIQSQLEVAEREAQEVEQQNSQLHSFNAGLRSLMVQLRTYAALHSRRSPESMRSLCRAPPTVHTPCLQNKLATHRLILDQLPL
ncbi:hypothetical protein GJAV_G00026400 [Gymnothorax javanicus]|nr:hypothetical protein GJAV_G00026400 [Gymnothorax javanicus]